MRKDNPRKKLFVMLVATVLAVLFVLAGCGGDDEGEEMMLELMGYKVTVTNNLMEKLAPIVVTRASNDAHLFTKDNYVTEAAEDQILRGWPCMVTDAIGEDAVSNHPTQPACVEENKVTVAAGDSSEPIMFNGDAAALRIIAMVAPSMYKDHYVSAVADVPMEGSVTVPLSRFDIGHDEGDMDIRLVAENAGTVTIERIGDAMAADGGMMDPVAYTIEVMNDLSEKLAPIVVTRANDEHYLFDGMYVTEAAKDLILRGWPCMVTDTIGEDAVSNHPTQPVCVEENKVTVAAGGSSEPIMFDTDAAAFRIIAMVAPSMVPDNYVSAVVNVAALEMPGDYIMAPLSRFDIGDDEMTMVIRRVDDDVDMMMTVGTVKVTRQ